MTFRDDARAAIDRPVSPVRPDAFLRELHGSLGERAAALDATIENRADGRVRSEIAPLVESIRSDVREVNAELDAPNEGAFTAIVVTLGTTHADQLEELDRIRAERRDELPEEACTVLDSIREHLLYIDVARNYFRTIYVEQELSVLSRRDSTSAFPPRSSSRLPWPCTSAPMSFRWRSTRLPSRSP